MNNEEIKGMQVHYRQLIDDLSTISEKISDFREVIRSVDSVFAENKSVSSEVFDRLIKLAQEYYTLDCSLKEQLPDVEDAKGFDVAEQKSLLNQRIEQLDQELIKNSVNNYFCLSGAEGENGELEATKADLQVLLSAAVIDTAAIRPYMSILKIVENPDEDLPDELMDEVDDTFTKPFVRSVLRGKIVLDGSAASAAPAAGAVADDHAGSGFSQTLD